MDIYRAEVLDADGHDPRLRWTTADGAVSERVLRREEADELVGATGDLYRVGEGSLAELGARLYRWLDGPTERWLASARALQRPLTVELDVAERLRALPWELAYDDGYVAVDPVAPVSPVRAASPRVQDQLGTANRPLRVLFMASSPLDVQPVLGFEDEEAVILDAASGLVELIVEESGSLEGLASVLEWFGHGYFDVLHLSGHAHIDTSGRPLFVMEDQTGARADHDARELSQALSGRWPGLVFVSGCSTAGAPDAGLVASMAESLVAAGARSVLGWALPVGDVSASHLAATLYQHLAKGLTIPDGVARARRALFDAQSPYWHLLRLYTDRSPVAPIVTTPATPHRVRVRVPDASTLFLDREGRVRVADRRTFVGRRRELQALLRGLRPADPTQGAQVAVIHGMGGLGKSTLTARLLERLRATHPYQAVWTGKIDTIRIGQFAGKLALPDATVDQQVNELLNLPDRTLADRLRFVLSGPLADEPCIFVFDDFESGNLDDDGQGGHLCQPEALEILRAFATAIRAAGSPSRLVITSRHDFPLPPEIQVERLPISQLEGADLTKKLRSLPNLSPTSPHTPETVRRAIAAGAGVPRLLERLNAVLDGHPADVDVAGLLDALDSEALRYREELVLKHLFANQPSSVRRAIALAAVFEIAVPRQALLALDPTRDMSTDVDAAVATGLIQAGLHPSTNEQRLLVSDLVRPLLLDSDERLDEDETAHVQGLAAQFLYKHWVHADAK